jgi:hypothetical protein
MALQSIFPCSWLTKEAEGGGRGVWDGVILEVKDKKIGNYEIW